MSYLLEIDNSTPEALAADILSMVDKFDAEISKAEPIFNIKGKKLIDIARDLPYHQRHYDELTREAKSLVKWLETEKSKTEAILTKNYLNGNRAFNQREISTLINGERQMVESNHLITEVELRHQKLDSIVEALKQMGWMVGHQTKLIVAELHRFEL